MHVLVGTTSLATGESLFYFCILGLRLPVQFELDMSVSSSFSGFLKTCNRLYFRRGREFDFNVGLLSKKIWPKTWPLNFQKHVHPNVDLYLATSLLKIQESQGPIGQHVEWDQWGDSPKKRRLDYDGNGMPKRPRRDDFMPGSPYGKSRRRWRTNLEQIAQVIPD